MAVTNASGMGLPTFVVGIATGGGMADATLSSMAVAGGYPRPGGSPSYYSVTSTQEFVSVLQTLVGVAGSCILPVPEPTGDTDRAHIGVKVNGTEIPQDPNHVNGWDYTSAGMTAVEVYGPQCAGIMNGTAQVQIVFKCIIN